MKTWKDELGNKFSKNDSSAWVPCVCVHGFVGMPMPSEKEALASAERHLTLAAGDWAWDCPKCKKPNIAIATKCWFCEAADPKLSLDI